MTERTTWIPFEAEGMSREQAEERDTLRSRFSEGIPYNKRWPHFTPEFVDTHSQEVNLSAIDKEVRMATNRYKEARLGQKEGNIKMETDLPFTIFFIGDIHYGSIFTDNNRMKQMAEKIKETPNTYVVLMSNLIDNAIPAQYPDSMLNNAIPPDKQVLFMRNFVKELDEAGKVLGAVESPCHEGWCVSSDTQVLSRDGWKTDVEIGEEILTFNKETEKFEYLPVEDKYVGDYDGEMYHFENDNVDLLCTPDHRLLYQYYYSQKKKWVTKFQEANKRTTYAGVRFWQTAELDKGVYEDTISFADLALIAWIITDGTIRRDGAVTIYQSTKHPATSERIREVLRLNNIEFKERLHKSGFGGLPVTGFNFRPTKKWLSKWFPNNFKLKIPREIMHQPPEKMRAFLRELMLGDGMKREFTYVTAYKSLAADVQELAIRAGIKATVRKRKGVKVFDVYMKEPDGRNGGNFVYPVRREGNGSFSKKEYQGKIWCPNTKNETIVTRRNGKVCVTGNTWKKTGQNVNALIFGYEGRRFPILENGGRLNIRCQGRNEYTLGIYHKIGPFRSNFNRTHGLKQMNRLKQNMECDVVAGAHYHVGAVEEVYEGVGDKRRVEKVYVQSGTLKGTGEVSDSWSIGRYGDTGQPTGQSVTFWPKEKRMTGSLDFDTGMLTHEAHYLREALRDE